jgi:hypothetical protein
MKRPIKPFVVEVRKGQKSQKKSAAAPELPSFDLFEEQPRESEALRRAEAALFGAVATRSDSSAAANRSGRILETIPDKAPTPAPAPEAPPTDARRRGRPPGSRNKPKDQGEAPQTLSLESLAPKRRGRPPRVAESSVRKVELTPELASAALQSIARASVARAPLPTRPAPRGSGPLGPVKQPRLAKRGRPAKVKLENESPAKVRRAQDKSAHLKPLREGKAAPARPLWSTPENHHPVPAAAVTQPRGPRDTLPRLLRIAAEQAQGDPAALLGALRRPRAGERWKRRLRGVTLVAYERRLKKSIAPPR